MAYSNDQKNSRAYNNSGYVHIRLNSLLAAKVVILRLFQHGYSKESDAYWCTEKFYNLKKEERDAVVEFINSI